MSPLEHGWADSFRREFLLPQRLCGKRTGNSSRAVKFARRARHPGQWWSTIRAHIRQYSACAASQRCTVRSLTSRTGARSFCHRSMAIRASRKLSSGHEAVNASVGGEFNGDWRARYPRWSARRSLSQVTSIDWPIIQVLRFRMLLEPQRSAVSVSKAPSACPFVVGGHEGFPVQSRLIATSPVRNVHFAGRDVVRHRRSPANTERWGS